MTVCAIEKGNTFKGNAVVVMAEFPPLVPVFPSLFFFLRQLAHRAQFCFDAYRCIMYLIGVSLSDATVAWVADSVVYDLSRWAESPTRCMCSSALGILDNLAFSLLA